MSWRGLNVLVVAECDRVRLESAKTLLRGRLARVAGVAAAGWPGLVVVVAGLLEALPHPVDEARQHPAVPVLENVGTRRQPSAAALVGQHGKFVDQVRMQRPAVGDAPASRRLPHVFRVDPLRHLVQPQPQFPPQPLVQACRRVPWVGQVGGMAELLLPLLATVLGLPQV